MDNMARVYLKQLFEQFLLLQSMSQRAASVSREKKCVCKPSMSVGKISGERPRSTRCASHLHGLER